MDRNLKNLVTGKRLFKEIKKKVSVNGRTKINVEFFIANDSNADVINYV